MLTSLQAGLVKTRPALQASVDDRRHLCEGCSNGQHAHQRLACFCPVNRQQLACGAATGKHTQNHMQSEAALRPNRKVGTGSLCGGKSCSKGAEFNRALAGTALAMRSATVVRAVGQARAIHFHANRRHHGRVDHTTPHPQHFPEPSAPGPVPGAPPPRPLPPPPPPPPALALLDGSVTCTNTPVSYTAAPSPPRRRACQRQRQAPAQCCRPTAACVACVGALQVWEY